MTKDDAAIVERIVHAVLERLGEGRAPRPPAPAAARPASPHLAVAHTPSGVVMHDDSPHITPRGAAMASAPPNAGQPPIDYCMKCVDQEKSRGRKRAVVTTTGRNRKGIVARLTQVVADAGGDILDISQTLISDYFTMIIVVDVSNLAVSFAEFKERVTASCAELELQSMIMHEEVMRSLQRV